MFLYARISFIEKYFWITFFLAANTLLYNQRTHCHGKILGSVDSAGSVSFWLGLGAPSIHSYFSFHCGHWWLQMLQDNHAMADTYFAQMGAKWTCTDKSSDLIGSWILGGRGVNEEQRTTPLRTCPLNHWATIVNCPQLFTSHQLQCISQKLSGILWSRTPFYSTSWKEILILLFQISKPYIKTGQIKSPD